MLIVSLSPHCRQYRVCITAVILQWTVFSVTNLLTEGHKCLATSVLSSNITCTPEDRHAGPKHAPRGLFQVPFIMCTVPAGCLSVSVHCLCSNIKQFLVHTHTFLSDGRGWAQTVSCIIQNFPVLYFRAAFRRTTSRPALFHASLSLGNIWRH